jgi:sigma-54 dependent transcriptional regulator, acetoin dehydrogenase operon transcriptional activator AcoR
MQDLSPMLYENDLVRTLMDSLPCGVMILDHRARVVTVNKALEKIIGPHSEFAGKGAGQSIGCVWTLGRANGCGHVEACTDCKMRRMVLSAVNGTQVINKKTSLELMVDGAVKHCTLRLSLAPLFIQNRQYAVMIIFDIGPLEPAPIASPDNSFHNIVGTDPKMRTVFNSIRNVAASDAAVLIQGESGTGKELVAAAIHKEGRRRDRPFVPFNCGALPEGMVESELFGHVKGAFTGAVKNKKGRFELAHSGTLFLDEVGELPPAVQVKLLRVLQDGTFERVGDEKTIQADVRIISATNKDIQQEVTAGRFRQDLFYRLCVIPFALPPLRDRKSDIPLLVDYFLSMYADMDTKNKVDVTPQTLEIFTSHHWPGNVRELQNVIQFALINNPENRIEPRHLPPHLDLSQAIRFPVKKRHRLDPADVSAALAQAKGKKQDAAKLLGISRSTLYRFFDQQEKITANQS